MLRVSLAALLSHGVSLSRISFSSLLVERGLTMSLSALCCHCSTALRMAGELCMSMRPVMLTYSAVARLMALSSQELVTDGRVCTISHDGFSAYSTVSDASLALSPSM